MIQLGSEMKCGKGTRDTLLFLYLARHVDDFRCDRKEKKWRRKESKTAICKER